MEGGRVVWLLRWEIGNQLWKYDCYLVLSPSMCVCECVCVCVDVGDEAD